MKRVLMLTFLMFYVFSIFSASARGIGVVINGESVVFNHEYGEPFSDSANRIQIPLRIATESLGCTVKWDELSNSAIVEKDGNVITVPVGENYILKNGKKLVNDTKSVAINGRIYLPIRIVAESLGGFVSWDSSTQSVMIDTTSKLMQVHFIDVGQGDSCLIDYGEYEILIDAGDNNKGCVVCEYIYPYIDGNIELIVATHPDADHIGGMDDVLKKYTVDRIIDSGYLSTTKTYSDYIGAVEDEGCIFEYDSDLSIVMGDGVLFNIIETGDDWGNSNDMSVVSSLTYGNTNVVFTGDISQKVENVNLDKFFNADVLKLAHHGSKTSSSAEFLHSVKPSYAVISAGQGNRYGHPTQEVLHRLSSIGAKVLGTYNSGNIILNINALNYAFNK